MRRKYRVIGYFFVLVVCFVFDAGNILLADGTVTINMTPETVAALKRSNCYLYAFKAVHSTDKAGRPLVWFRISPDSILPTTFVKWSSQYQAYTSSDKLIQNHKIDVGFNIAIEIEEVLEVDEYGMGEVRSGKDTKAISIKNTATNSWTCGISQLWEGGSPDRPPPFCAFPLYGKSLQIITPLEKVLLMFSTEKVEPGTVITYFSSADSKVLELVFSGILINLTNSNERSVSFDINLGWKWNGTWADEVSADSDFIPLLIEEKKEN